MERQCEGCHCAQSVRPCVFLGKQKAPQCRATIQPGGGGGGGQCGCPHTAALWQITQARGAMPVVKQDPGKRSWKPECVGDRSGGGGGPSSFRAGPFDSHLTFVRFNLDWIRKKASRVSWGLDQWSTATKWFKYTLSAFSLQRLLDQILKRSNSWATDDRWRWRHAFALLNRLMKWTVPSDRAAYELNYRCRSWAQRQQSFSLLVSCVYITYYYSSYRSVFLKDQIRGNLSKAQTVI